jgi:hypothetical protein
MQEGSSNLKDTILSSPDSTDSNNIWRDAVPESLDLEINYPPLFNAEDFEVNRRPSSGEKASLGTVACMGMKLNKDKLLFAEWYLTNLGGIAFVVASFLFDRKYKTPVHLWAAILFIMGSTFYTAASSIVFIRNDCASWKDPGLSMNALMYLVSNSLFIIGSFFFIPSVEAENALLVTGLWIFIIACTIFLAAPAYDTYRTLTSSVEISNQYIIAELSVTSMFMLGNTCFIIGCVVYLPSIGMEDLGLFLFILGSFLFLFATFILSITQAVKNLGWQTKEKGGTSSHDIGTLGEAGEGGTKDMEKGCKREGEGGNTRNPLQTTMTTSKG